MSQEHFFILMTREGHLRGACSDLESLIRRARRWIKKQPKQSLFYQKCIGQFGETLLESRYVFVAKNDLNKVREHCKEINIISPNNIGFLVIKK